MKQALSPAVIAGVLAALVIGLGLFFWRQSSGVAGASGGRLKSDLGPAETDPEKFKKGMDELLAKEKRGR